MSDLCIRCGRCCRIKVEIDGCLHIGAHCRWYREKRLEDGVYGECLIYEDRFDREPSCLTIDEAIEARELPEDCPYVPEGYESTVEW